MKNFFCILQKLVGSVTINVLKDSLFYAMGKQAMGKDVKTVGYLMKPSREEDFAKVSSGGKMS